MPKLRNELLATIAGGAFTLALAMPASALDIDAGIASVGVGLDNGISVDVGVNARGVQANSSNTIGGGGVLGGTGGGLLGGNSLVESNTTATIGGVATAKSRTTVGGTTGLVDSRTTANVLGFGAKAGATVLGDDIADLGVCVDTCGTVNPGPNPGPNPNPNIDDPFGNIISGMSSAELARNKKLCRNILADSSAYDRDLVGLCQMLQMASR